MLTREIAQKSANPQRDMLPMTLEGCVVRMGDSISYVGRDIEDAIRLGLIHRNDFPRSCKEVLGDSNGTIVYRLVEDLVAGSLDRPYLRFSEVVGEALRQLKSFNQEHIYRNPKVKDQTEKVRLMFELLFERYLSDLEKGNEISDIYREFLEGMSSDYEAKTPPAGIVRDFIAGMTDEYFLEQCRKNLIPQIRTRRFFEQRDQG
jgi:dGTPase